MILGSVFSEYDLHMLSEESKMVMHTKGQMHYEYICKYILNTHKEGTYNENSKGLYQNYPGFPGEGHHVPRCDKCYPGCGWIKACN